MAALLVEAIGLCLLAPILLYRIRAKRIAFSCLLILAAALAILIISHFRQAWSIDRDLAQRTWYTLALDETGGLSATIQPLPRVEGIHVSIVDFPKSTEPPADMIRSAPWRLVDSRQSDFDFTRWFDAAILTCEDDGLPLFELGDRPLKTSVTLWVDANPEEIPWIKLVRLQVRPCWFSLKMYPIIAGYYRLRGIVCCVGLALSALATCLRLRSRFHPTTPSTSASIPTQSPP